MADQPSGEPVGRTFPIVTLGRADGLPSGQIHGLASARGGQLWCATPNGLARHDGLRATVLTRENGLSTHGLRCVALTPDGDVWAGGDVVLQDDRIVVVDADDRAAILTTTADALAGWTLVLGRDDDVYVGGSSGLRRYDLHTGDVLLHCTLWMGLAGWEFTTSRSLLRDEHDRLLCGLSSGFTAVHLPGLRSLANDRPDVE